MGIIIYNINPLLQIHDTLIAKSQKCLSFIHILTVVTQCVYWRWKNIDCHKKYVCTSDVFLMNNKINVYSLVFNWKLLKKKKCKILVNIVVTSLNLF